MTRLACARARDAGIDLPPLLRRAGLSTEDVDNVGVRLSVAAQIDLVNSVAAAIGDPLLGYQLTRDMDLRLTGYLYYIASSSENLGQAIEGIARYSSMVNDGIQLRTELDDRLRIEFEYAGISRLSDRHQIEGWITAVLRCCREITDRTLQPVAVRIMHQRIPESAELDRFFGCTVEFGADRDEIALAVEAGKLPIFNADPFLNKLVVGYCDELLARRGSRAGTLQADVENALAALLPHGRTRIEFVAHKLGVSPRTLRRKLATEGITFATILDDLRHALARHYLAEHQFSISRIAWLLGYTDVSAFSHAFRRWTGRTPRSDRHRARTTASPASQLRRARH
jgi:AraC-like DNA-binding protein